MEALRQKMRSKHQILILKCYPKLPRNTTQQDIKPNGSELSYLLYYASSRRSKLTKVGTFLERKTSADVYKGRTPSILVTLQILSALLASSDIAKGGGFELIAPFALRILHEVLGNASDVSVVDTCLPVWDAFCRDADHSTLAADAEYRASFTAVVRQWADYASKDTGGQKKLGGNRGTLQLSVSDGIKLRKAGLQAMASIAASETLASDPGRQLDVVMPVVLQNLYSQDPDYLAKLQAREKEQAKELLDQQRPAMPRPSISTIHTTKTNEESDPRAAGGTAADADKIAEEEAALLALDCLKKIYAVDNRGQVRLATVSLLAFIVQHGKRASSASSRASEKPVSTALPPGTSWSTALVKTVCNWTPVQDRFVVLFSTVETLIRSPVAEAEMQKQLVLSHIVGQVLGSDINLIGLSVMDILLGLVQHILLILQIGTRHTVLNGGSEITSSDEDLKSSQHNSPINTSDMETARTPSPARVQLLAYVHTCIANLAVHVYYTDQIADMVTAILMRLKPTLSAIQTPAQSASAIEDPTAAAAEVASNASLKERPNIDGFFSFDTAREVALNAVKNIIAVANTARLDGSTVAANRNLVPISVWEGTQWLLRDPSAEVRRTYIDALCTWVKLETRKDDSVLEDNTKPPKHSHEHESGNNMARRAVSNASARTRAARKGRSTFLQLLHLAIYEDALRRAPENNADTDFLLLHLLMTSLVEKLGINAIRTGLPMIFRLQEDIQTVPGPTAKIRLGSLVHGYLWAVSSKFDLDTSVVGREIFVEIERRKGGGMWLEGMMVPASEISTIPSTNASGAAIKPDMVASESLEPFDHRQSLIDQIASAYLVAADPLPSPPGSPGRSFSLPVLHTPDEASSYLSAQSSEPSRKLPAYVFAELSADWSKSALLAAIQAAAPKSISLSGSRTGNTAGSSQTPFGSSANLAGQGLGNHRHLLAAANTFPIQRSPDGSPTRRSGQRAVTAHSNRAQLDSRMASKSRSPAGRRRYSASTTGPVQSTRTNSVSGTTRIDELKRVLAGAPAGGSLIGRKFSHQEDDDDDSGSESMVDVDGMSAFDDESGSSQAERTLSANGEDQATPRPWSMAKSFEPGAAAAQELNAAGAGIIVGNGYEAIPTMKTFGPSDVQSQAEPPATSSSSDYSRPMSRRTVGSRASNKTFGGAAAKKDLDSLLRSIHVPEEEAEAEREKDGVIAPPY